MASINRIIIFWVLSLGWLVFAYHAGGMIPDQQLWFALLVTLLFGIPLYMAAAYSVTIQRIHRANQFRNLGILYWFLNKRILPYIGWALWSVTFTFLLVFYLGVTQKIEWVVFFLTVPVFTCFYAVLAPLAAREFKPYIALHKSLIWSRWATALAMAAFYVLYVKLASGYPSYASLTEAIASRSLGIDGASQSILILEASRLLGFIEGLKAYILGNLHSLNDIIFLVAVFLGSAVLFYNIALAISSFMVPLSEYRRVLSPLQDVDVPARIPPRSLAVASALMTFFMLFIYVPSIVYVDAWLRSTPRIVEYLQETQVAVAEKIESLEKIGDDYYKPGTIAQTRQAYLEVVHELESSIHQLRKTTDQSFMLMAQNVDDYLDWYYSLPGEYERIVALATGKLENWMIERLEAYLMQGNAFGPVQQSIEDALRKNEQLRAEYLEKINSILTENQIKPETQQPEIIQYSPLDAIKEPPSNSVIVNLENRLLISGGIGAAGAITGAIAGKVTGKVIAKGAISLGAKALVKVAAGKAASVLGGAAAGAASGAAIGSVFPGIGTAIGATIGGIIGGISVGLGVEHLLLKLEEHYSRDEFKKQILDAIDEARLEFEESLGMPGHDSGLNPR
ncbi:hypothetical protein [Nitrosomonas sp.]|uniref:hypothetical protein n=1 Tax=Nitrosomonas sp. TaxID=42353 RepID=UPI00283F5EC0|nr:hypothetical protein [Nitrosomonas sp.]MCP5243469.1 hypothetical protein [Burkholderiales bacterium]MDR4515575.1 hypothetical protein [Nitrosomonas sp.]